MHGLNRIKAINEKAAADQLASKSKRPATFNRSGNNGRPRFPATSELTDRRPAPHGDPLGSAALNATGKSETTSENRANENADYDRGFMDGYDAALLYVGL